MKASLARFATMTLVAWLTAAGCGFGARSNHEGSPPPSSDTTGTVKAALTASAAPDLGVSSGVFAAIPVQGFPLDRVCIHHHADGTCVLPSASDEDADGVPAGLDCNDHDPYVYPGAPEAKCDGVDEDCDGTDFCPPDQDGDGFSPPVDCDDKNPKRNPRAEEVFCNGIDENCNGVDDCDADHDGDDASGDCNDHDPTISLHASEIMCDGIDQDCNGSDCCANDEDGDGAPCSADCDDRDPKTFPGAPVPPGCYAKDVNCDGTIDGLCH